MVFALALGIAGQAPSRWKIYLAVCQAATLIKSSGRGRTQGQPQLSRLLSIRIKISLKADEGIAYRSSIKAHIPPRSRVRETENFEHYGTKFCDASLTWPCLTQVSRADFVDKNTAPSACECGACQMAF
jgi:hypothetical protein